MLTPHEDKVDVISPVNILFRWGGDFLCDDDGDGDDDDDDADADDADDDDADDDDDHHDDCKCAATSGLGRRC